MPTGAHSRPGQPPAVGGKIPAVLLCSHPLCSARRPPNAVATRRALPCVSRHRQCGQPSRPACIATANRRNSTRAQAHKHYLSARAQHCPLSSAPPAAHLHRPASATRGGDEGARPSQKNTLFFGFFNGRGTRQAGKQTGTRGVVSALGGGQTEMKKGDCLQLLSLESLLSSS